MQSGVTWGVVTSVENDAVMGRLSGDTRDVHLSLKLDGYTPVSGDKIAIARVASTLVVLGKIVDVI